MMNSIKINYVALGVTLAVVLLITTHQLYNRNKTVNLKELLSVSLELAERGGAKTFEVKQKHIELNAESKGLTKEGAKELKTTADKESHFEIMAGFKKVYPGLSDRIVSEEHEAIPDIDAAPASKIRPEVASLPDQMVKADDISIWVDPLDATQEYTEGNMDQYITVMICVAVKGEPTLGIIHRPFTANGYKKETVWAWVGKGTSPNINAVDASAKTEPPAAPKVIISRSHAGSAGAVVKEAFGGGDAIPAGGAGYKVLEVIQGRADTYAHVTLIKKWDICAGNALLNAVGGQMKTLTNEVIDYKKSGSVKNEHGLLSSMNNFDYYLEKLSPVAKKIAESGH